MYYPIRDKLCKILSEDAKNKESRYAQTLRKEIQTNSASAGQKYLAIGNDQDFLKTILTDALLQGGKYGGVAYNFGTQPFQINQAEFTIDGTTYQLSQNRCQDITNVYNGWDPNNLPNNWQSRLASIIVEEAGEMIMNAGLTKFIGQFGGNLHTAFQYPGSNVWEVDSTMSYTYSSGIYNNIFDKFHLDHKMNVQDFHVATSDIYLNNNTVFDPNASIPDNLMTHLINDRIKDFYPVYYSVAEKQVLLASDILKNPNGFYLTEPKEYTDTMLSQMAQHIYNDWMEGEGEAPDGKTLYRTAERSVMEEITPGTMIPYLWKRLQGTAFHTELWYQQKNMKDVSTYIAQ